MCWRGIFKNISEINEKIDSMDGQYWTEYAWKTRKWERCNAKLLKQVADQIPEKEITIIDWGGGFENTYKNLVNLKKDIFFKYYIIETSSICSKALEIKKDWPIFKEVIPNIKSDIVYCRSALQYALNWKDVVVSWLQTNPQFIVLEELVAGEIPTYLSIQTFGEIKIPYWFFNIGELESLLDEYTLVTMSRENGFIMQQDNFPESHRIGKTCDVVYKRLRD